MTYYGDIPNKEKKRIYWIISWNFEINRDTFMQYIEENEDIALKKFFDEQYKENVTIGVKVFDMGPITDKNFVNGWLLGPNVLEHKEMRRYISTLKGKYFNWEMFQKKA